MNLSEYAARPKHFVLHNPRLFNELRAISSDTLSKHHYTHVPDTSLLYEQYDTFQETLKETGVRVLELADLLSTSQRHHLQDLCDPNAMFTRDPVITLPWAPNVFVPARFALQSRAQSGVVFQKALTNLGMKSIARFTGDEYVEGGDVLPLWHDGMRWLLVGYGGRTTKAGARALARQLVPAYADMVVGLRHRESALHLDTGFSVLTPHLALVVSNMFSGGFVADNVKEGRIEPTDYLHFLGIDSLPITNQDALERQLCNVLPLGNKKFVTFQLPTHLNQELSSHGLHLYEVNGSELAKAVGGTHCLTRPIY